LTSTIAVARKIFLGLPLKEQYVLTYVVDEPCVSAGRLLLFLDPLSFVA
jgi:hypothetical protein